MDQKLHLNNMKIRKLLTIIAFSALTLSSCKSPKETLYFIDSKDADTEQIAKQEEIKFRPGDKVYIYVNSKDQALMNLYNIIVPNGVRNSTYSSTLSFGYGQNSTYYIIDKNGDIEFPVLGKIHIAGLTRQEVADKIQNELRTKNYVNDAVVTVEYRDMYVTVLGEVSKPGKYDINKDKYTLLDLLGNCGDITVYGLRDRVKVYREENGQRHTYQVNLTAADSTFNSPVYYLQQDDVVYVEPNDVRRRQATATGNSLLTPSLWISMASLLCTVSMLIFK